MSVLKFGIKGKKSDINIKSLSTDNKTKDSSNLVERVNQFQSGSQINGQLVSQNSCYFNGIINGNIEIHNKLVLGENSEVIGDVYAKNLLIKGKVKGNIIVENKIILSNSSNISSNSLYTNLIEVENGAVLNVSNLVMQAAEKNALLFPKLPVFAVSESSNYATGTTPKPKSTNTIPEINTSNDDDNTFFFKIFQNQ